MGCPPPRSRDPEKSTPSYLHHPGATQAKPDVAMAAGPAKRPRDFISIWMMGVSRRRRKDPPAFDPFHPRSARGQDLLGEVRGRRVFLFFARCGATACSPVGCAHSGRRLAPGGRAWPRRARLESAAPQQLNSELRGRKRLSCRQQGHGMLGPLTTTQTAIRASLTRGRQSGQESPGCSRHGRAPRAEGVPGVDGYSPGPSERKATANMQSHPPYPPEFAAADD